MHRFTAIFALCFYSTILSVSNSFRLSRSTSLRIRSRTCELNSNDLIRCRPLQSQQSSDISPSPEGGLDGKELDSENVFDVLRSKLRGTCIYLIGMMGSGKSTTGKLLAQGLGYRFLDTDEIAEYMIEMPISEFFAQGKEKEFRELEYQILMEMAQYTRVVTSTGGGIVEKNENWGQLRHGLVIHLDMSPEDIFQRLSSNPDEISKRPLLRTEDPLAKLRQLSDDREGKYSQADIAVQISQGEDSTAIAHKVASQLVSFIDENPPLWQTWKESRDKTAVEAAARMNPSATASANVGFGEGKLGSIQYVSLSDIKSGKVILPESSSIPDGLIEGLPKSSGDLQAPEAE